ncbi:hypothetical protein P7K49_017156 [Saguinus oedipus]|uniref:Ig-like domain-containing protein n=1 Tax=Saguinus oedipus TaxID=9490 RepID=A0ABQ9V2E9_SAGOE|nr:hypothetical protein P7K49_017156 [Saguinus oedipus]
MTLEPNKDLRPGDTVTITCSSYRGYPEAEVFWQDGQGAPLTSNVTTSQMANEQGLFDVHSVLRVVLGANGTYSCLVRNPVLQQDAHGSVTITPQRSPTGAVEVQVPEDPVVALVDTDATLRCSFSPEPGFSLAQLNLIWQLTDTKQLVHSFTKGRDQGSAYANRTALFPDLLAQGNASLRLQRVRVADEGSFTCFVSIRDFGSAAVSLQVAAPYSKPSMTLEPNKDLRPGDTVTITCSSYRGYPEAEVFWQDGQGTPLNSNVTTSQMANEQGLFDVHSVLRVVLGANGTYSCLVRNPVLQQDAHGFVTITDLGCSTRSEEMSHDQNPTLASQPNFPSSPPASLLFVLEQTSAQDPAEYRMDVQMLCKVEPHRLCSKQLLALPKIRYADHRAAYFSNGHDSQIILLP